MDRIWIKGLDSVVEHVSEGVVCVRGDGHVIHANSRACELLDMSQDELAEVNLKYKVPYLGLCDALEKKQFINEKHEVAGDRAFVISTFPMSFSEKDPMVCCVLMI